MKRSVSVVLMTAGLAILVGTAWFYLQGKQTQTAPATAAAGNTGVPSGEASPSNGEGSGNPSPNPLVAQDQGEGGVKVMGALLTPEAVRQDASLAEPAGQLDPDKEIGVLITFETHSGDLSTLDLTALSTLRSPAGDHKAVRWISESDSSHHRSGVLVFERDDLDLGADGKLVLTIRDVAGIPVRTLTWALPVE